VRSFGAWCVFILAGLGNVTKKCWRHKNARIHSIPVVIHKEKVAKTEKYQVFSVTVLDVGQSCRPGAFSSIPSEWRMPTRRSPLLFSRIFTL
jgi:hypothetical protein